MKAILSDIHSNLEALEAVLEDIDKNNIDEIICLGDTVGYGPNPRECIDIAMDFGISVKGNHDEAALFENEAAFFNQNARDALEWTRRELDSDRNINRRQKRWDFLGEDCLRSYVLGDILLVHGSPRNPVREYIFPEIVNLPEKLANIFERIEHTCFIGHTHIPGVFTEDLKYFNPEQIGNQYSLNNHKVIINVGSVGQPRDGKPDASYVIMNENKVEFRRVEYDYIETMKKIYAVPYLDRSLALRLAEGR